MRLICPNCGAQYEVPSNVIPEGGRDVQCSNCGHTWFQAHPDDDVELGRPMPDEHGAPEPEAEPETPPEPEAEPEPEPDADAEPQPAAPRQRGLDPSVAEVLREEAQREAARRAAEAGTLESQPELGLSEPADDEAARRSRASRDRMSRMRTDVSPEETPDTVPETAAVAAAAGSRRELLPDIEEINQTLRASSERRSMETPQGRAAIEEEEEAQRSGFSSGFRLILGLAILAVALYMLAPRLAEMMPGLAPALDAYVDRIDMLRLWLDGQVTALLQMLDGMSSEATGE